MIVILALALVAMILVAGGLMLSRNNQQQEARHWEYIASRLRQELNEAADALDRYAPTDASTQLSQRIVMLAARVNFKRRACMDCNAAHTQANTPQL